MSLSLTMDFQYNKSIEKVWHALTDSDMLEKWIWKNDFKPVVGHKFTFRAEPSEWWDGIVKGEVLEVDEPNMISYTWASGAEEHVVTWTLTETPDGNTNLHLDQTGIHSEDGLKGAQYGWTNMSEQLTAVLEEQ